MRQPCRYPNCEQLARSRGLCSRHYQSEQKAGRLPEYVVKKLGVNVCGHPERKHGAKGMCDSCYTSQWLRAHPNANSGNNWVRLNPEKARILTRRASLRKQHGITMEEYESRWKTQKGRCGNRRCGFEAPLMVADFRHLGLQVDHDHDTGKHRGLLCRQCNIALGQLKDSQQRLRGLVEYLNRWR